MPCPAQIRRQSLPVSSHDQRPMPHAWRKVTGSTNRQTQRQLPAWTGNAPGQSRTQTHVAGDAGTSVTAGIIGRNRSIWLPIGCQPDIAILEKSAKSLKRLVTPRGFEPLTYRLGICRSILLSYGALISSNSKENRTPPDKFTPSDYRRPNRWEMPLGLSLSPVCGSCG